MKVVITAVTLFLASMSVQAANGVVEINQARALAGGITPGDAAGFPVTISQPGSYRLTGSLNVGSAGVDAIDVTASDVTIDLGGFAIVGPQKCDNVSCTATGTGNGISTTQPRLRVLNGSIAGFQDGILAISGSVFSDLRLDSNSSYGIFGGAAADLRDLTVTHCATGLWASSGRIHDCVAESNRSDGIDIGNGTIEHCDIESNANYGVEVGGSAILANNAVLNNAAFGFYVDAGHQAGYSGNVLVGNYTTQVHGTFVSLGPNDCSGALCP